MALKWLMVMPVRSIPLANNEIYHVLNRGLNSIPIFTQKRDYQRFFETFLFYQNYRPPIKFSRLKTLSREEREKLLERLRKKKDWEVKIIAYCLMPNHFHFLLKQLKDSGITDFIRRLDDSYSHYFNTKYERKGSLFEGRFKAIRVETDEQLLHLSRYIHLNPYSSFVIKDLNQLVDYSYSSLREYIGVDQANICQKEIVSDQFSSFEAYNKFVFNQADYQRALEQIKHQMLD